MMTGYQIFSDEGTVFRRVNENQFRITGKTVIHIDKTQQCIRFENETEQGVDVVIEVKDKE